MHAQTHTEAHAQTHTDTFPCMHRHPQRHILRLAQTLTCIHRGLNACRVKTNALLQEPERQRSGQRKEEVKAQVTVRM